MDYSYSKTNDGAGATEDAGFRSLDVISKALVAMLLFGAFLILMNEIVDLLQLQLLSGPYSHEDAVQNDLRVSGVELGVSVMVLVTFPVFGTWIVRAHRNLPALGAERLDVTPGWALGWFFIPIANLWRPFSSMRTLWKASHDGPRWEFEDVPWWMAVWWVGWIVSGLLNRVVVGMTRPNMSVAELADVTVVNMVTSGVMLVVHGLAALMVYRIWRAQNTQLDARAIPQPPSLRDALPSAAPPPG
jgi:hypothetical protein